jgi:CRP-like cAMP-binding protein
MEFNNVKGAVNNSSLLSGLPKELLAELVWGAEEINVTKGDKIYTEGTELDGTFCILLEGTLEISQDGEHKKFVVPEDPDEGKYPVLGGFAYFHRDHIRTVTVTTESETASVLKLSVPANELLSNERFSNLKERLSTATGRHWSEDQ